VSRGFILGPKGLVLGFLVVIKLISGSLYTTAIVVQSFAVDQAVFVPFNATLIMLANALTGIIIWEDWRSVQSWLGYMCVFALLGLGCDLLLSIPLLNDENPEFGLRTRVSSIIPLSKISLPPHVDYEEIPEVDTYKESGRGLESTHQSFITPLKSGRRISRADAWREIVSPIATASRRRRHTIDQFDLQPERFAGNFADLTIP
jgi:hypothetical protein